MKFCFYHLFFPLFLGFASVAVAAGEECSYAYEDSKDEANFEICRSQADKGNSEAQFLFGLVLMSGAGREPRIKESLEWFHRSARQRFLLAQVLLGRVLSDPRFGAALNEPEAYAWWVVAGERDSATELWERLSEAQRQQANKLAKEYVASYASTH